MCLDLCPPPHIQGQRQKLTWVLKEQQKPSRPVEEAAGGRQGQPEKATAGVSAHVQGRDGDKVRKGQAGEAGHLLPGATPGQQVDFSPDYVKFRWWGKSSTCEVIRQDQII